MVLKSFVQTVLLSIVALGLVVAYLRYTERRTLFYPAKEVIYSPKEIGLGYEDVFFKTPDGMVLNGWFIPSENAVYTILFCHGNAGNICHRLEKIRFFHEISCNVFIFDYRGYGRSKGSPSENGLYLDAKAAYDYLISRAAGPGQIVGYGESLGGAVIIDLAYKNKLAGLITSSTFSSFKDMLRSIYPFLPYWIFRSRMDSLEKVKSIETPKLIIHSLNDEIVPYALGRKLYDTASEPKEFLEMHGGHNSAFFESEGIIKEKIIDFIKRLPR